MGFSWRSLFHVGWHGFSRCDIHARVGDVGMTAADVTELSPIFLSTDRGGQAGSSLDFLGNPGTAPEVRGDETDDDGDTAKAKGDADDETAPCCQNTGPCQWDTVCQAHVLGWEQTHRESYLAFLTRSGAVVPEWLRCEGAVPGQRGSGAAGATAGVGLDAADGDEEEDIGLLGNGGHDALVEVAGRSEADGVSEPFAQESMMDLDDDDEAAPPVCDPLFCDPLIRAAARRGAQARDAETGALRLDEDAIQ